MSEELYNSNDFCKLAEEFEELKKENAELSRDKDRLMNLFMERSEYVFDTSANMKIESLTRKCKALEADCAVSNREMLLMQVEIGELKSELARRDEIIARLKEDGEKLAETHIYAARYGDTNCIHCARVEDNGNIDHKDDCPITLHRALMKEMISELKEFEPERYKDMPAEGVILLPPTKGARMPPSLREYVNAYFKFRNYKEPDTIQAFLFLTSEVGELADKLVHRQSEEWVRNHPEDKDDDVAGEIADVLMMLTKVADTMNLNPADCMVEKMARKGFHGKD